jgi:hypothetical protein
MMMMMMIRRQGALIAVAGQGASDEAWLFLGCRQRSRNTTASI